MSQRIIHKTVSIIAILALITTLTLSMMGTISNFIFWLTAIACVGVVYLLKKE